MNIHINSEGEVTYPSGVKHSLTEQFNCKQTPTVVTEQLLESPDPIQAYKDWIMLDSEDIPEEEFDYEAWDENTQYYPVIGYKTYNWAKDHCIELDSFIGDAIVKGMKLDIYSM
jgi:hypothetical protein